MIISASRRCDIPRFQFGWFLERLEAGFVDVANPFNAAQLKHVSLKPEDAKFLVFWTRDPRPILCEPGRLENYPFYVMCGLTGYPNTLEPNMPAAEEIIRAMEALVKRWGKKRLVWRYDPIFLSSLTDFSFHRRNFADLASRLSGIVERVIISIYDEYSGSKRRLLALEKDGLCETFPHYTKDGGFLPELRDLLTELAFIASTAGIEMQSCAEKEELDSLGIKAGACIDRARVQEILGCSLSGIESRDKNQRSLCRCAPSVDIGSYGSCQAGCVYCYARR